MNSASSPPPRSFQFTLRTMLLATAVLAAFLSVLKWTWCPTIVIVTFMAMLAVDVVAIAILLWIDAIRRRTVRRGRPADSNREP